MSKWFTSLLLVCAVAVANAQELPPGYLSVADSAPILEKTLEIRMDPDLQYLSEGETAALALLIEVGKRMHALYETQKHHQALEAYLALEALNGRLQSQATANLVDLYRLYKGPVGRNLQGDVLPFVPVDGRVPGRNLYPWGVDRAEVDAFLAANDDASESILHLRTLVRRATDENIRLDIIHLDNNPLVESLQPGLREKLQATLEHADDGGFYAIPYSLAYAQQLLEVYDLLNRAAGLIEASDDEFARYLRLRAVDLLSDDYEAGDAAWVTGRFGNLNAQIGAYEPYDDYLFGVKTFFSTSLLLRDPVMSSSLETVSGWLQEFEDKLPYEPRKTVRSDIPIGVYDIIADFGQARGTNTATILPNESYITSKYGRTILIRRNILQNPQLFQVRKDAFDAALAEQYHEYYLPEGDLFRTLFHEVGHYLGPDYTEDGRTLDAAFEEDSSILEELKADLISLYLAKGLYKRGYYTKQRYNAVMAAGVRRVLRKSLPDKSQTYATMQLMQFNYFLEQGMLDFDPATTQLSIEFGKYHQAAQAMLRDVLALQYSGDKAAADDFIGRYTQWDPDLNGALGDAMRATERYRYVIVRYAALGE